MVKDGKLQLNLNDEIIRETLVTHGGEIVNARVREFFSMPALVPRSCVPRICLRDGQDEEFEPDSTAYSSSCWPGFIGFEVIRRVSRCCTLR